MRTCSRVVPQGCSTNLPSPAMGLTLSWACAGVARQISAAHGADNAAAVMRVRAGRMGWGVLEVRRWCKEGKPHLFRRGAPRKLTTEQQRQQVLFANYARMTGAQ